MRQCGPSLLNGTQSAAADLTVIRENLVWLISFERKYGKCLCFGLRLYTSDDLVRRKVLLEYSW